MPDQDATADSASEATNTAAIAAEWRTANALVRSEAVYLDAVDADGGHAIVARICRFPALGTQWVWLHVFAHGTLYSFTRHDLPCANEPTDLALDAAHYACSGSEFPASELSGNEHGKGRREPRGSTLEFTRHGPLAAPSAALARFSIDCQRPVALPDDATVFAMPAHGAGSVRIEGSIAFTAGAARVSNREGRHEMLGRADVTLHIDGRPLAFSARAHFHEQEQDDPRFALPFSYATLRAAERGFIFIRGMRGVRGQFVEGTRSTAIVRVDLEAPAARRAITLVLDDGRQFAGVLTARCRYVIPIFDETRPGSFATLALDGEAFSGCVNDYGVDRLPWRTGARNA